jgi:positive regulator of sigma E activity
MEQKDIEHIGIVKEKKQKTISVSVKSTPDCTYCPAQSDCLMGDSLQERVIVVDCHQNNFQLGERVRVVGQITSGLRIIFAAYVLPVLAIVLALVMAKALKVDEWLAGGIALVVAGFYYTSFYYLTKDIRHKYTFRVEPLPEENDLA